MHDHSSGRTSLLDPRSQAARCPYCHATTVADGGRRSSSAYSRCETCGQVWHPDRIGGRRVRPAGAA